MTNIKTTPNGNIKVYNDAIVDKVLATLILISKKTTTFSLTEIIRNAPYANNIGSVLTNIGIVKSISRGKYIKGDFIVKDELAKQIIQECRDITTPSKRKHREKVQEIKQELKQEAEQKPNVIVSHNPFGFTSFDEIYIEKGSIQIGEYTLTGTFTIRKTSDINSKDSNNENN